METLNAYFGGLVVLTLVIGGYYIYKLLDNQSYMEAYNPHFVDGMKDGWLKSMLQDIMKDYWVNNHPTLFSGLFGTYVYASLKSSYKVFCWCFICYTATFIYLSI